MTILHRNSGTFNTTTAVTVTRSSGNFGTGTTVVVALFGNTTFTTPGGWTQRTNSVVNLGLYSYDRTGAGEASFAFTAGAAGSGEWYVWELSAGSAWSTGSATQSNTAASSYTTPSITPAAADLHLLAAAGGTNGSSLARNVLTFSNSFTEWADAQVAAQDWPFSAAADRDVTSAGGTSYSTLATFNGATGSAEGGFTLAYSTAAADVTPPTVPAGLATTAIGSTTTDFSWTASTDAVGVTQYELIVVGP